MSDAPAETTATPSNGTLPRERNTGTLGLIGKVILLGAVLALAVYALPLLIEYELWMWLAVMIAATVGIFIIYSTKRFIPGKYLFPGTLLLSVFLVIPVVLTVGYSFTNFGDGSRGSKQETIDSIIVSSVQQTPDSKWYHMSVAVEDGDAAERGPYTLFLIAESDDSDTVMFGLDDSELAQWSGESPTIIDHTVTAVPGYQILTRAEINSNMARIQEVWIRIPGTEDASIKVQGFRAFEGRATMDYDSENDRFVRNDGTVYPLQLVGDSYCYSDPTDSSQCYQGRSWLQNVGLRNYTKLLTDSNIRGQFLGAFSWTLVFALGSVALTFIVGFFLALTLNDERIKGKKLWRSFLLLPYAVPGMISLLIWSGFFNPQTNPFGWSIDWLADPTLAKIAVFIAQLWMGFPYMFIVCTGALQSIPADVKEAASIDGSSGLSTTFRIILPLLLVSVAPLLVASFAFNFNNFNAIQLLTQGGPVLEGQFTRGGTDILISMIYKRAFGGSGADFGFAASLSVLLFILTGVLAAFQFRITKKLEDMA
ncbi:MAG: ABC transporter permease subunit [Propionibacteriaceae bacterium]|jgi:arabinogalactan oligomer/maltooligosaccharide transport system permease protein|nr:ABC transporter permease subunit [Propionibacteriaceae bacterium]